MRSAAGGAPGSAGDAGEVPDQTAAGSHVDDPLHCRRGGSVLAGAARGRAPRRAAKVRFVPTKRRLPTGRPRALQPILRFRVALSDFQPHRRRLALLLHAIRISAASAPHCRGRDGVAAAAGGAAAPTVRCGRGATAAACAALAVAARQRALCGGPGRADVAASACAPPKCPNRATQRVCAPAARQHLQPRNPGRPRSEPPP